MVKRKNAEIKLPDFDDLEELSDAVDTLDASSFMTPERLVECEVKLKSTRNLVAVDPDILRKVRKYAKTRGISSESLINLWVQQKLGTNLSKKKQKAS